MTKTALENYMRDLKERIDEEGELVNEMQIHHHAIGFFFFQAEDGIRDGRVTGVQTCALPIFTALPGSEPADHHTAGIIMGPSLAYMDRAYCDARLTGASREPIIEMLIPSTLDDTLAPSGAHVASLFCQHVAPQLPDGRSWNDARESVADLMIETVDRYAPGFKASIIAREALSPLDLERIFGLTG